MYTKPIIYKIYSVIIFVLAVASVVGSIIIAIVGGNIVNKLFPDLTAIWIPIVCLIIGSLISLFFAYVEFSSMFTFAQMIEHEVKGVKEPIKRMGFVLPPKFYRVFGTVLFYVPLIIDIIGIVVSIIIYSSNKKAFIAIPVLPIALTLIPLVLSYITYFCRYKTFGDLLELKSSASPKANTLQSMSENKPNTLRGYCVFLYILAIIEFIGAIISLFFVAGPIASVAGTGMAVFACIGIIVLAIVMFLVFGIIGCYYDNLAKMLEHYMLKNKLL